MDLRSELDIMRENYHRKPIRHKRLPRPLWLTDDDDLSALYTEKDILFSRGEVYYACIVQANDLLFSASDRDDHPAAFLFTSDKNAVCDLELLESTASLLMKYKNIKEENIPETLREITAAITDELDRSVFRFNAEYNGRRARLIFVPAMIFREDIPSVVLRKRFLPILAVPEYCRSILVLPKKYWSKGFTAFWNSGE